MRRIEITMGGSIEIAPPLRSSSLSQMPPSIFRSRPDAGLMPPSAAPRRDPRRSKSHSALYRMMNSLHPLGLCQALEPLQVDALLLQRADEALHDPVDSASPTYEGLVVIPSHFTSLIQASAMYCAPCPSRKVHPSDSLGIRGP